jgi:hypothetical protein
MIDNTSLGSYGGFAAGDFADAGWGGGDFGPSPASISVTPVDATPLTFDTVPGAIVATPVNFNLQPVDTGTPLVAQPWSEPSQPVLPSQPAQPALPSLPSQSPGWAPSPADLQSDFRASERDYRRATDPSVPGSSHLALPGDTISDILGTSSPQAVGNFMRANGLDTDQIVAGRHYFVPDSRTAYGDSSSLGQFALDLGNQRSLAPALSGPPMGADGLRIGPTIERSQLLGFSASPGAPQGLPALSLPLAYPEMRAPVYSTRETAVNWFSDVVGSSRAGNVLTGAFDAWLAAPEALSKAPDLLSNLPAATGRLADGISSYAGRLWDDPWATLSGSIAGGVDGLRDGFRQAVYGDGRAMGSALFALGTGGVVARGRSMLGAADEALGWPGVGGAGPVAGTIGITDTTSTAALRNYFPRGGGIEFVYDPTDRLFVTGAPRAGLFTGSPHEQLARSIGSFDNPQLVGGTLQRGPAGEFFTTENSGHYGHRWNDEVRGQFSDWLGGRVGMPVQHESWGKK